MSENSKIEWTDHTFNPWEGCQKVGPGCDHCYAEARNARFGSGSAPNWGPGAPRRRTSVSNWRKPTAWNAAHDEFFATNGRRQRVFCASLADVFDNAVDPAWLADLFDLIARTPNLDWLLLTKRIGNVKPLLREVRPMGDREDGLSQSKGKLEHWGHCVADDWLNGKPPKNVWLGATIVNQEEADRDIPKLLALPARVRFLCMEPLLEPVTIWKYAEPHCERHPGELDTDGKCAACEGRGLWDLGDDNLTEDEKAPIRSGVDWVIVGGESGADARPMHPDWARSLRDQCRAAGVPFLFKQWGEHVVLEDGAEACRVCGCTWNNACSGGCSWAEQGLCSSCVDCEPASGDRAVKFARIGKHAAGRELDGVTHDGFPGGAS